MDAYDNQEPILPLDRSVLKQPVLPWQVFSIEADAASGRICSKAACAVPEDGLQQPVVHQDCQSTRGSAAPRRVCLQELWCAPQASVDYIEPVLHLYVSVCKSFVLHIKVSVFKILCCTCACLSTSALCCTFAYLSTIVLCCTWTCLPTNKSPVYDIPYLEEYSSQNSFCLFRFFSKQICLFRLFWYVFETPKQTEKKICWFHETNRKTTETDCVLVLFGSNRKYFLFVSRTP